MTAREIWKEIERALRPTGPAVEYIVTHLVLWEIPGGLQGFLAATPRGYHVRTERESGNVIIVRQTD